MMLTMVNRRSVLLSVLVFWLAQGPAWPLPWTLTTAAVHAALISETTAVSPGKPFAIGVLLTIDPGWHVYWSNPGQSGLPTTVEWLLPRGYSAGPLLWPIPERFDTEGIVTYGYSNQVLLLAEITPPAADPERVAAVIGAKVGWLACRVECTPGSAELTLSLPVSAVGAVTDGRWASAFKAARAAVPVTADEVSFQARVMPGRVTLTAAGLEVAPGAHVAFFPAREGEIDDAAPQAVSATPGSLLLELRRPSPADVMERLQGVLSIGEAGATRSFELDVALEGQPASARAGTPGLLVALLLSFAGGLLLNLMPCVLPVISLKVISLVKNAKEAGHGRLRHGLLFSGGIVAAFLAVGAVLVILRSAGSLLGWGFQFQDPVVVAICAILFFLIGLNLFGVFEVGSSLTRLGAPSQVRSPAVRSLLGGLFAGIVATPCTAPFMAAALGYALSHPAPQALAVFALLGVGMAAPYLVLSALPDIGAVLPAPGRWMETLRQVMGFPMMGAVVWMLFILSALSGASTLIAVPAALLAAGFGAWIWGRWGRVDASRAVRLRAGIAAVLVILGAAAFAVACTGPRRAPPAGETAPSSPWETWTPQRVQELRAQRVPVFVDFTARWCLTCQVNEQVALNDPGVQKGFRDLGVAVLRADWTGRSDQIAAALADLGRAGVPVYALYPPGAAEPVLLPELLTPAIVLAALNAEL